MDPLESLEFSSFIIFSDDPWSLLVSFCQLFKLPLVVQCCDVICEWPLSTISSSFSSSQSSELRFPVNGSLHSDHNQKSLQDLRSGSLARNLYTRADILEQKLESSSKYDNAILPCLMFFLCAVYDISF